MFPTSFPHLYTKRLFLRRIRPKDKSNIFTGLSDPDVIRFYGISFTTLENTEEQMDWYEQLWQEQTGLWWAICDKDTGAFLGACGYNEYLAEEQKVELGYWILPPYWRKGYASEALQLIIPFAFRVLKVKRIEAFVELGNVASDALLEKHGFSYESTMRNCEYKNDHFISLKVFSLPA